MSGSWDDGRHRGEDTLNEQPYRVKIKTSLNAKGFHQAEVSAQGQDPEQVKADMLDAWNWLAANFRLVPGGAKE